MVSETTPMVLAEGHKHTMALDQSALLEVLEALKAAEVDDRIRRLEAAARGPGFWQRCTRGVLLRRQDDQGRLGGPG